MSEFDPVKGAFYLVATVFGFYAVALFIGELSCIYLVLYAGKEICSAGDKVYEALGTLLASALAYGAGRVSK